MGGQALVALLEEAKLMPLEERDYMRRPRTKKVAPPDEGEEIILREKALGYHVERRRRAKDDSWLFAVAVVLALGLLKAIAG